MFRIGVDLGGTNIAAGLVDDNYKIVDRESVKTNVPRPAESIVQDIAGLVNVLRERNNLEEKERLSVSVFREQSMRIRGMWSIQTTYALRMYHL